MKSGSKELFNETVVGCFVAGVLALLIFFTIVISGVDLLSGRKRETLTVLFQNVGGLRAHDHVIARGMPVGIVQELQLVPEGVRVTLVVDRGVAVREKYRVRIVANSLLGGNNLVIDEGTGAPLPRTVELAGETPSEWMRDLGETLAEMRRIVSDEDLVGNLRKASISLAAVTERLEKGEGTLGKLLSADTTLYQNLAAGAASLRDTAEKLEKGENSIARLINDDGAVYLDFRSVLADMRTVMDRLEQGRGTLGKLLSDDEKFYQDFSQSVERLKNILVRMDEGRGTLGRLLSDDGEMHANLQELSDNLRIVSERLAQGEGTLGRLARDDKLYRDVEGLIGDLRETVDNMRETTPLTTFGSILMGGL